jgi:hypothetical protein
VSGQRQEQQSRSPIPASGAPRPVARGLLPESDESVAAFLRSSTCLLHRALHRDVTRTGAVGGRARL